ncbi:MAG: hypothetical protein ACLQVY_01370 [Limisphaerales bacterium]
MPKSIHKDIVITGIAQVAVEELLAAQLGLRNFDQIKANIKGSVYWEEFAALSKVGEVPEDWLRGAVGRTILGWARSHWNE